MVVDRSTSLLSLCDTQHMEALDRIWDAGYYIEDYAINRDIDNSEFYSTAKWVINELCIRVQSHITEPPLVVIEKFRDEFIWFSKNCTHEDNVTFCEWVLDVTEFVIDQFM